MKKHATRLFLPALFVLLCRAETVNYTYDNAGRLTRVDYGSGASITYTYDPAGNLLNSVVKTTSDTPASAANSGKQSSPDAVKTRKERRRGSTPIQNATSSDSGRRR